MEHTHLIWSCSLAIFPEHKLLENGPKQPERLLLKIMIQLCAEVLQFIEIVVEIPTFS